jgi:uncharacterized protein
MTEQEDRGRPAPLRFEDVVAVDVHTHVHASVCGPSEAHDPDRLKAFHEYFKSDVLRANVHEMADYYRERKMMAVVFTVDTYTVSGDDPSPSNEEIAELAAEYPDVLIPFASLDPGRGMGAVKAARRLLERYSVKGFKFHPNTQAFFANDRAVYPLYEVIEEAHVPALFHSGHTGVGAMTRGGGGVRLKYSNPMSLDDVAVDFPDLPIIIAHPSFPWQDEALSVARHKPLVHIDLSGWSPKYFDPKLVQHANSILQDKVLFGSDFPVILPERWIHDFDALDIKDSVRPKILKENAVRLLGLS